MIISQHAFLVSSPTSTAVSATVTPLATDPDDTAFPPEHPCHRTGDHVCARAVPAPEDLSTLRPSITITAGPKTTSTSHNSTTSTSTTTKFTPPQYPCYRWGKWICDKDDQKRAVPAPEDLSTIRPSITTTTTSSAANATQTLDKAALELLAALADDSPPTPQTEGPGCAPGNSPGGDPNAGDCEKLKRNPSEPPTADRNQDVEIDNLATETNKTESAPDNYIESDIDFGRVSIKRRVAVPTSRPPPTADRDRDVEIDNVKRHKKHKIKTKTKTHSTTTTPPLAPTPDSYVDSGIDFGRVSIKKRDPSPTDLPPTADRNRDVEIDNGKRDLTESPNKHGFDDDDAPANRNPDSDKRDLTQPPNAHGFDDDQPANRNPDAVDERDTNGLGNEEDGGAGLNEGAGNASGWRITKMYTEFDSGAWVRNLGGECRVGRD
jgi:hypothetical protein